MDKITLKALRGSIKKWEGIVAGKVVDRGADNCPLCVKFVLKTRTCSGCPVSEKTGAPGCKQSPWERWVCNGGGFGFTGDTPFRKRLAQAELNFLKKLLPKRKVKK